MENRDYIVAIDLGSNSVVTIVGTKTEDGKINVIDFETSPVQGVVRSEIKNIDQVAGSIKKTVEAIEERQGIKIAEAYTGISGQHLRCVKYPYYVFIGQDGEIREEDVQKLHESMGNVQAPDGETIIQIIPQNYIVDGEETDNPVGSFGNKLEANFNFVLGDTNAVSRLKRALSRVNIRQSGLAVNALAVADAVATEDEKQAGVAIVDIGAGTTDVAIYYRNILRHIAIIPIGGNVINRDIQSYGILERHVESLKEKYGSAVRERAQADKYITTPGLNPRVPKEISFQNLAAIIEARMLDIIDFVMAEIKASGCEKELAGGVILTGGASQLKDLDLLFKNYTGIDVRVASPEAVLCEECWELASKPVMANAVGLLRKAAMEGKTTKADRMRTINTANAATAQQTTTTPAPNFGGRGVSKKTLNERYRKEERSEDVPSFDEETDEQDNAQKRRTGNGNGGGLFKKLKSKLDNMFDVIEDNEI